MSCTADMTKRQIDDAIDALLPRIIEQASPLRVLVFGSAIRPTAGKVHDLDFLVIVPDRARPATVMDRLNVGIRQKPMPCDFLVATPSMLNRCGNRKDSVFFEALAHGRELYAR